MTTSPLRLPWLFALAAWIGVGTGCASLRVQPPPSRAAPLGKFLVLGGPCAPTPPEVPVEIVGHREVPPGTAKVSIVDVLVRYSGSVPPEDPEAVQELRRQARLSGAEILGLVRRSTSSDDTRHAVLFTADGFRSTSRPCAADGSRSEDAASNGDVSAPVFLSAGEQPHFTLQALRDGAAGTVAVDCELSEEGTPRDCRLRGSIHPTMDGVILGAVMSRRYKPAMRDGIPIAVRYSFVISMVAPPGFMPGP